jgi:hypothetical protein
MIVPPLLLQKPPGKSKPKALIGHLEHRLSLWADGDLESLLEEGRLAQNKLHSSYKPTVSATSGNLVRRFINFMMVGNVNTALRLLEDNSCGRTLSLNSLVNGHSVKDILCDKHPPGQPSDPSIIMPVSTTFVYHPILFDSLTPERNRWTSLKISGSAGPSGLDDYN